MYSTVLILSLFCPILTIIQTYSLRGKIRSLAYSTIMRKLLSTAEDGQLGVWDLDQEREEVMVVRREGKVIEDTLVSARGSIYFKF